MVILTRQIHGLGQLGLRNLKGIDPTDSHARLVNLQHDLGGSRLILAKIPLKNMNDKFHRGIVVIEHNDFIELRTLGFGAFFQQGAAIWGTAFWRFGGFFNCLILA